MTPDENGAAPDVGVRSSHDSTEPTDPEALSLRRWLRPWPLEIVVWTIFLGSVLFLRSQGLNVDWVTFRYTLGPFVNAAPRLILLGVLAHFAWMVAASVWQRSPLPVERYLEVLRTPRWYLAWLRLYVCYALLFYTYTWVKVSVPLVRSDLYDASFWSIDRVLHLGVQPNVFFANLLGGTSLAGFLDSWYGLWLTTVVWLVAFLTCARRERLRRSFILSCALLWMLGAWMYMALPAVGPCYAYPDSVEASRADLPRATNMQQGLWSNYQRIVRGRDQGNLRQFNPLLGVAAMPSLHVGAHVLLMLWIRRTMRPLWALAVVGVALTFFGSVATGWHYAIDGYAGALLAWASFRAALWLENPGELTTLGRLAEGEATETETDEPQPGL